MAIVRVGAVSYLNSRPLVQGLERRREEFTVRYDLPSTCAALLHAHEIDLGLIPSIEYLRGDAYLAVPGCAVTSDGPVASVALFARVPIERVTTIALDTSSRTSVALTRVLSEGYFGIRPAYVEHGPDLPRMLQRAEAALLIGEPALFADWRGLGVRKIDLGDAWKAFTGLPFVYAVWAGHPGALSPAGVRALQESRAQGEAELDQVASRFFREDPARAAVGARYLREHIRFGLGEREQAGLERFFALAAGIGVVARTQPLRWYGR